jgi:HlyD family secretion protein
MLLLIGCQGKISQEAQTAPVVSLPVVDVQRQNIPILINITGTAIAPPNTSAKISPAVAGKLAAVNVVPGQQVGKGQVIARLDSRQISEQVNQATAALRSSQAGVVQARTNLHLAKKTLQQQRQLYSPNGSTPALRQAQAGVAQARTNLDLAQKTLQQQRQLYSPDGSTPALRQAQAGVEQAKANLVLAINSLERSRLLYKEKIAPKKDLIAAENQVSVAQSQLKLATATVEQVIPQKDLIAAQNQVQVAVAQLTTAQAQVEQIIPKKDLLAAENQVQVAESQLAAAIAQQQQASASREQVQTQLSFTEIRSPIAGIVANRLLNTGDTADPATPVVQVVNLSKVIINGSLPADNKADIRVGQIANIRTLTDGNYSGVVTAVSPIVDPQSNTRSIQISVSNPGGQLKENQTVSVSITTDIHTAAITVPQTALVPDPENPAGRMVYTVKDGKMERKKVETGIQQKDNVEILSGLVGNERVVAKGAYGLEDGTAIKEVKQ